MAYPSTARHSQAAARPPDVHETRPRWGLAAATSVGAVAVAGGVTAALAADPRTGAALRDVLAVARSGDDLPYYTGWATYTGVLAFVVAGAVALFAASACWSTARRDSTALACIGLLSLVLGVDDLYMLHDGYLRQLGVPEQAVLGSWAVLAVLWVVVFRRLLLAAPETPVLVVAALFLAHSFAADVVGNVLLHEEGTKLAGALAWALWAVLAGRRLVVGMRPGSSSDVVATTVGT